MEVKIIAAAIVALQLMITCAALSKVFMRRPLKSVIPKKIEREFFEVIPAQASQLYLERGTISLYELTRDVQALLNTQLATLPHSEQVQYRFALMSLKRMYINKVWLVLATAPLSIGAWVYIGFHV